MCADTCSFVAQFTLFEFIQPKQKTVMSSAKKHIFYKIYKNDREKEISLQHLNINERHETKDTIYTVFVVISVNE